ncbi:hypothetical protein B484DRAFT_215197 [Ochromonadaceae sp. CCMP2298]|nr:hypothetical protein B484DRAFT_215197 [Ochromonadaceae sp. CCMP2298]
MHKRIPPPSLLALPSHSLSYSGLLEKPSAECRATSQQDNTEIRCFLSEFYRILCFEFLLPFVLVVLCGNLRGELLITAFTSSLHSISSFNLLPRIEQCQGSSSAMGKGKKVFHKPPGDPVKKASSKKQSLSTVTVVGLLAVVVAILAALVFGDRPWPLSQVKQVLSKEPAAEAPDYVPSAPGETNTIPSYDEFIALSKKNGWVPADPVLKLESTISKYTQIFDVVQAGDSSNLERLLGMLEHELKYLLAILCASTERPVDLTAALGRSIEVLQDAVYRSMKTALASGRAKMITRSQSTPPLGHWMFSPSREIMRVLVLGLPHLLSRPDAQLIQALNQPDAGEVEGVGEAGAIAEAGAGGDVGSGNVFDTVLLRAVQFRLYRMVSLIAASSLDHTTTLSAAAPSAAALYASLRTAVFHGDDVAVLLLLKAITARVTGRMADGAPGVAEPLRRSEELARRLNFTHIEHRIAAVSGALALASAEGAGAAADAVEGAEGSNTGAAALQRSMEGFGVYNEQMSFHRTKNHYSAAKCAHAGAGGDGGTTLSEGGLLAFRVGRVMGEGEEYGGLGEGGTWGWLNRGRHPGVEERTCAIDRVDIAHLDVGRFVRDYVSINRPVIITSTPVTSPASTSVSWALDALLQKHGAVSDTAGSIPYATLFGGSERVSSLREYVDHPARGMRAFTQRLASIVSRSPALCDDTGGYVLNATHILGALAAYSDSSSDSSSGSGGAIIDGSSDVSGNGGDAMGVLPMYVFSGAQQKLGQAMRGEMLRAVKAFGDAPASASASPGPLLDLMYAVDRTCSNSTTASNSGRAGAGARARARGGFSTGWKSQFYLGPPLSGAPFHHHGPAFNLLQFGRKEWTLLPPGRDIYSSVHPLEWIRDGGAAAEYFPYKDSTTEAGAAGADDIPCSFTQHPGEVLFLPRHWTHQVLNLAESVGFAVEISDYLY